MLSEIGKQYFWPDFLDDLGYNRATDAEMRELSLQNMLVGNSKLVSFILLTAPIKFTVVMLTGNSMFYVALIISLAYKLFVYMYLGLL